MTLPEKLTTLIQRYQDQRASYVARVAQLDNDIAILQRVKADLLTQTIKSADVPVLLDLLTKE